MSDYYPQPDEDDAAAPSKAEVGDEEQMDGETALLPKSILGGKEFQPGQEVVLKIVREHGDQVEVQYATEKDGEGEEDEGGGAAPESEMDGAMGRMGSMGGT